jgi:hypothetical protein
VNATQALQTREAAAVSAWVVYQRNVRNLSIAAICVLAGSEPIRREDGSYSFDGGIGRQLAQSTAYRYLKEAREQFRDEYVKRPILDMLMEEDDRLEHLAAIHMADARAADVGTDKRAKALDSYLRTLESRRKLLGIDRPQQIEVTTSTGHDDPATVKMKAALVEAQKRKDAALAHIQADDDE